MVTTEISDISDSELKILSFVEGTKYQIDAKQNLLLDFQLYVDLDSFCFSWKFC